MSEAIGAHGTGKGKQLMIIYDDDDDDDGDGDEKVSQGLRILSHHSSTCSSPTMPRQ